MKTKKMIEYCIDSLLEAGADKAQCYINISKKDELNVESGEINLFRTNFDTSVKLTAIIDEKKGTYSLNKEDQDSIDAAVEEVIALATTSKPDPANDISPAQPQKIFKSGPTNIDADRMYDSLDQFLEYAKEKYPDTIYEQLILEYKKSNIYYMNSNGVDLQTNKGIYGMSAMFTSKKGKKTSSFNYTGFVTQELAMPLQKYGYLDELLQQSSEQLDLKSFPGKISGDIIITPHCLNQFINYLARYLSDYYLITGNSIYKDSLNKKIADTKFTLHSNPVADEIEDKAFITGDGYIAKNNTVIKDGVLNNFLLSLYGAKKTGYKRAPNKSYRWIVDPGEKSHHDMIKDVDNGILLCRFSGGNPNDNGDFSGVAKNSYYIKDGEIQYPISETMIAGNLKELFNNIVNISRNRIDFGSDIFPWIHFSDLTIAGK